MLHSSFSWGSLTFIIILRCHRLIITHFDWLSFIYLVLCCRLTLLLSLCLSLTCCLLSHLSLAVSLYLWLPLSCWFALGSSLILSPLLTFLSSRAFVVLITCGSFMTMPPTRSSLSLYSMLYIYVYISVYVCVCLCLCVLCKAMQIWRVWQFPIMASRLVSSSPSSSSLLLLVDWLLSALPLSSLSALLRWLSSAHILRLLLHGLCKWKRGKWKWKEEAERKEKAAY